MTRKNQHFAYEHGKYEAAFSGLVFLCSIFAAVKPTSAQQIQLQIEDCNTGHTLQGVHVIDQYNHQLAVTDENGNCQLSNVSPPLYFEKGGYDVSPVYDAKILENRMICLHRKETTLQEVQIKAKKVNLQDYLIQLRDKNLPLFITHPTTLYYHFDYKLEFPKDKWQETASGYIAYVWKRHGTVTPKVYYLSYHYHSTNKEFWNNPVYDSVKPLGIFHVFSYNIMGNYPGYKKMWNRIINKESKGIKIPRFLLSKKQKDLLKEIETHPEKYQQYWHNGRKLGLRFATNGDRIFNAYYDTTNNIMEQVVFDSLLRLKNVFYFTPEQLNSNGIPFDNEQRERTLNKSRINNDGSYYHSAYFYDVQHKPIVLDSVNHTSSFIFKGHPYVSSLQLKRVNSVSEKDFKIQILFDTETKGKDVFKDIRRVNQ